MNEEIHHDHNPRPVRKDRELQELKFSSLADEK